MKRTEAIAGVVLGLMAGAAHAVPGNYEIIQTQTFSDSLSSFNPAGGTYSPTTPQIATVNPFSSYSTGSGTLNSVTVRWNTTWSFAGMSGINGGIATLDGTGDAYVGSIAYSGNNFVKSANVSPNSPITLNATWAGSNPSDYVFTLPYTGGYNPAITAILMGSSPFTVAFGSTSDGAGSWGSFTYSGIASGLVTANADVTVKYSYFGEQVPVPVPATLALLGLGLAGIGAVRRKQA